MRIILLISTLFLSLTIVAQSGKRRDVYLKDGKIIRGTIYLEDPGKFVQIRTIGNSFWVLKYDQIDSITPHVRSKSVQTNGYFNLTETGVLSGYFSNIFSIMNISSWKFSNGLTLGAGAGFESSNEKYLPVVADIRYYFRKVRPLPFVSLQAGYSIPLGGSYEQTIHVLNSRRIHHINYKNPPTSSTNDPITASGGFLINPALGFQTPINENFALTFSAGYRWMHFKYKQTDNYNLDIDFNRVSLKFGLLFK